jgi:tRNA-(ms[2]io[6]A)-hydroxylase
VAEENLPELLTDHAWCEQKAASNAISLMVSYPEYPRLVEQMVQIAQEELTHFAQVHERILQRGWELGRERKDAYVNDIATFMRKGGSREDNLVERLLFAALIEARSCERFRVLSEYLADNDPELAAFYRELMASEADHYTVFLGFAREVGGREKVDTRWREFLAFEGELIQRYGQRETMHG